MNKIATLYFQVECFVKTQIVAQKHVFIRLFMHNARQKPYTAACTAFIDLVKWENDWKNIFKQKNKSTN